MSHTGLLKRKFVFSHEASMTSLPRVQVYSTLVSSAEAIVLRKDEGQPQIELKYGGRKHVYKIHSS
jgi:hypothetical protein